MTGCVHRWECAPDLVENVPARCLRCGAERTFAAGFPWLVDAPLSLNARPVNLERSRKPRGVAAGRGDRGAMAVE